ncbi:DUF1800 domain-containing protein [Tahibacter harae]|uniref:DUF1800 domain-containing protein n=1 Tax=Tahibacter harae TaxID=2963937 RepID=A0ABT1QUL7_9GAMM|nr:DUF1800 domain-containing protein [Tahibacter harae]MCQ4165982.1 DUF1800 domain-containing protein [Tahibacter harae]
MRLFLRALVLLAGLWPALPAFAAELVFRDGFETSLRPATRGEAARFLTQATFGPSDSTVDALAASDYAAWIQAQTALPPSFVLPYMRTQAGIGNPLEPIPFHYFRQAWFVRVLDAPDQLRQRVAFALSEILVVSERGNALGNDGLALGAYYDILLRNALGNYRQLLEDVTLSPAMGRYLSMYRNRKPDPANNIQSDENYAREVMQLFSIGLVKLNRDGTPVLVNGQTVPTYDGDVVRGFARVFTGWACHCGPGQPCPADPFPVEPFTCSTEHEMVPYENYHDQGEKRVLDGVVLPAGVTARAELEHALDILFQHPNVAPFVSRQLIQRLVTSNPSPAYVERVASVFENNGQGVRGDLAATVAAILLDREARTPQPDSAAFGKVREPLLRLTALWRAFDVMWENDELFPNDREIHETHNQSPLFSPSVFNFFSPAYAPGGALADAGKVAPEMQIITASFAISLANDVSNRVFWGYRGGPMDEFDDRVRLIQLQRWEQALRPAAGENEAPAGAVDRLLDRCAELLLGGRISPALRSRIRSRVLALPADEPLRRVQNAIYLMATSPEFAVQR